MGNACRERGAGTCKYSATERVIQPSKSTASGHRRFTHENTARGISITIGTSRGPSSLTRERPLTRRLIDRWLKVRLVNRQTDMWDQLEAALAYRLVRIHSVDPLHRLYEPEASSGALAIDEAVEGLWGRRLCGIWAIGLVHVEPCF